MRPSVLTCLCTLWTFCSFGTGFRTIGTGFGTVGTGFGTIGTVGTVIITRTTAAWLLQLPQCAAQ